MIVLPAGADRFKPKFNQHVSFKKINNLLPSSIRFYLTDVYATFTKNEYKCDMVELVIG